MAVYQHESRSVELLSLSAPDLIRIFNTTIPLLPSARGSNLSYLNVLMPGKLLSWPSWPEFTEAEGEHIEDLLQCKEDIAAQYGVQSLRHSWVRVCKELEKVTATLAEQGTSAIPDVQYNELS